MHETHGKRPLRIGRWLGGVAACVAVGTMFYLQREHTDRIALPAADESARAAIESGPLGGAAVAREPASAVATPVDAGAVKWTDRTAVVRHGEVLRTLSHNARGEFPRLAAPAETALAVEVAFPGVAIGERIAVTAEDGGALLDEAAEGTVTARAAGRVSLGFRTAAFDGLQRVTVRRGGEQRVLNSGSAPSHRC